MPSPSYTYTLTNGTTADASQVMQNFNDIKNGVTDGTKDLSISALTCAGTATLNGNVNLGNASGDDLTVTASLASTIPIKTTASYDIGSSTLGLRALYFGRNSQTVNIQGSSSMSATWTLTLPVTAGTAGHVLSTNGSGTTSWVPGQWDLNAVSSADYTITDTDNYATIYVTTDSSNRTVTLPTAADNTDRRITVKKADSGTGSVIVDGEGAETIDGSATVLLYKQYEAVTLRCTGTAWIIESAEWFSIKYTPTATAVTASTSTSGVELAWATRLSATAVQVVGVFVITSSLGNDVICSLTLPVASNFGATTDATGLPIAVRGSTNTVDPGRIQANSTTDVVDVIFEVWSTASAQTVSYNYTYDII